MLAYNKYLLFNVRGMNI